MTTPDEQLRLFTVAGRLAADRWYTEDQAIRCLMACLREVGLDPETAITTEHGKRLIDSFWKGGASVPLWSPEDGDDDMAAIS